ncbi:MAG: gas vesicle protein K [Deltaproteobacteria bacterium]|nr:gas vesicle protein K [Deltaproteobacteria bacterium]MBI5809766.1 gas vesicle protein K [Deltaproteobacteria bacterium]
MLNIDEKNAKKGLLGLAMAIVEIIAEVLKHQALRRMEGGSLSMDEVERLGRALKEIDRAILEIKEDYGLQETVRSLRDSLDGVLNDAIGIYEQD